ncbi:adenosylmethionine decarboxylase [Anaerolineales bacterium HSG24]|nr:adenosylmethionine decarboxylase [Anaerolineales bacterium HSG24]
MPELFKLGEHYICEMWGCDPTLLHDNQQLGQQFIQVAERHNLSIVDKGQFEFAPHGFTCYLLLAESHASLHSWPEHNYCAIDLFTCNLTIDVAPFFDALKKALKGDKLTIQKIDRGIPKREV